MIHARLGRALMAMVCACLAGVALPAQDAALSEARSLIERLSRRQSAPPIAELAKLDAANIEVCRGLAAELPKLQPDVAARIVGYLVDSSNPSAHALLLDVCARGGPDAASLASNALMSLDYAEVVRLGQAADALRPGMVAELKGHAVWNTIVRERLLDIFSLSDTRRRSPEERHRQRAFALLIDLYAGPDGFRLWVNELIRGLVGEEIEGLDTADPPPDSASNEKEDDEENPDEAREDAAASRIRLARRRREAAQDIFAQLIMIAPSRFQLAGSGFDIRREAVKTFWDTYTRLLDAPTTWREHLRALSRRGEAVTDRARALLLMSDLCGGVTMDVPKRNADGVLAPDGETEQVPVFRGEKDADKISAFLALDRRDGQRPRIRAIYAAFDATFGPEEKK